MSIIKHALIDVEDALGGEELTVHEHAIAGKRALRRRAEIMVTYRDLRSGGLSIQHRTLRTVLMALHGVATTGEGAFNARLKHVLDLHLVEDRRTDGKGWRTYGLVDVLEIALCLQLQRSFVPPATAVRFIVDNRVDLDKFWSEAPLGRAPRLYVEVDAFVAIGGAGRDKGRGSRGNEVGAISMSRLAHLNADAVPPSSLIVDMADLQRRVQDQLVRAGVRDDLKNDR